MAYIEENMKLRRGGQEEPKQDAGPADPYAELFRITDRYKIDKEKKEQEEGSVTNSMAMLTAIPEVDLGMEYVTCLYMALLLLTNASLALASRTSRRPRKLSVC